jgi:hypothetical protein
MNKITTAMLIAGIVALSACADDAVKADPASEEMAATQSAEETAAATSEPEASSSEESAAEAVEEIVEEEIVEEEVLAESMDTDTGNLVSTCTNGDAERIISVIYDNEETGTVCEVTYEKASGVQTLWSANNERDYCLDKARAFVEKQRGWGWTCSDL